MSERQRITLRSKDGKSRGVVSATIVKQFAIHPSLRRGRYYSITHLPSMGSIGDYANLSNVYLALNAIEMVANDVMINLNAREFSDEEKRFFYEATRKYRAG